MAREILFTGSVPLSPATAVFEILSDAVSDSVQRLPDGEQGGWLLAVTPQLDSHPALEVKREVQTTGKGWFSLRRSPRLGLRDGFKADDVKLGPYGIAENAIRSYGEFRILKDAGRIPSHIRFQATVPGTMTATGRLRLDYEQFCKVAEPPLIAEIEAIVAAIPADQLAIQIDLAVEVEAEEYRRNPQGFDAPGFADFPWSMAQTVASNARLAAAVPADVELGFHLCGLWHIDQDAGQDMNVHVDFANALTAAVGRPITYLHLPTIPKHAGEDFAPLADLKLGLQCKLFIGVLHAQDGLEGARRRITDAAAVRPDFGIAYFCGLSQYEPGPAFVPPVLELHKQAASI